MKTKRMSKSLALVLLLGMLLSLLPAAAFAAETDASWTRVRPEDITDKDTVAITMSEDGVTWLLPASGGENDGQSPAVEARVSGDTLTADAAAFGWTLTKSGETFTIKNASGCFLCVSNTDGGVRIGDTAAAWSLKDGYLTAEDPDGAVCRLGVSGGKEWKCCSGAQDALEGQTLAFWKLSAEPAAEPSQAPTVFFERKTDAPAEGDEILIFHPYSGVALNDTVSDGMLAGAKGELKDGKLAKTAGMAVLTVRKSGEQLQFVLNGKYLTCAETGGGLSFEADGESDLAKWTPALQKDGTWYLMNVGAVRDKAHDQALAYAKGFTTDGAKENSDDFKFDFYTEIKPKPADGTKVDTISEALAGESGASFTVKGVVTMVESKSIYIQDETGGINLFYDEAAPAADAAPVSMPSDVALGDTLIATGTRASHKGLPELSVTDCEKSEGLTLKAKETTIGALTTAELCTYVMLKGLEVTEVYDKNGAYSNPNITVRDARGDTIQIYKAVLNKTTEGVWRVKVGDVIDFSGAVCINDSEIQLRNTLDGEIRLQGEDPVTVATPTADKASGEIEKDTVVTFSCETEDAVIWTSTDGGKSWTKGSSYKVTEDVTIQVKAVKGEIESEIASFAYTVKKQGPAAGDLRVTVSDDPVVPEKLQERYPTVDRMKMAMLNTVKRRLGTTPIKGSRFYELTVEIFDGSAWLPATPEQFPSKGVKVSLEIPEGASASDRFMALHLFGEDCNGHKAGEGELPTVTVNGGELEFTIHGMSPLLLVWTGDGTEPAVPTADKASGEVEAGTEIRFGCETDGAEIYYSTDGGATWTQGDAYVVNESVKLQVKSVKDGVESGIASFTYTVPDSPLPTEKPEPTDTPETPEPTEKPAEKVYIDLDANGGKVSVTRVTVGEDGKVPALPTPQERDGYIFGGWFEDKGDGLQVVQGDIMTESTTLYARWYELRATATENTKVPEALKKTYASVSAMKTAMLNTVKKRLATTTVKGEKLYEIQVEYFNGSEWLPIEADQFPTKGVKVSITIPSGAATTDRFVALHLFGEDCNGHKAGEGEMPTVTKSGTTLSFTVHGTSPLLLVWTGTSSSNSGNGKTPKTGDEANLTLWIGLMAASSAAMAALWIGQKKRKNRA